MTPTMAAAVFRGHGAVVVEQRPVPSPGSGEVLVAVDHCGVCGTDLHMMVDDWGTPGQVFGHEFSGRIAAIGPDVDEWKLGELVVGGAPPSCGDCRRCTDRQPSQCERRGDIAAAYDGAFAEYTLVDQRSLLRVPHGVDARTAALTEPLAVALHGIARANVRPGDSALVLGAGPVGALVVATLVARGIGPVIVVEPGEARRALASELGASEVVLPEALEVFPMWEPERIATRAVDVVFECSGKRPAVEAGFHQLRRGGRLVLLGSGMELPTFDPNRMILNELTVTGSFNYDDDGFEQALALLASGTLPVDRLIDPTDVPLDGLVDALHALANGHIAGKAMVVPITKETT